MSQPKWSYCLTEDQFNKLKRIIDKISGLSSYLTQNDDWDLCRLISDFTYMRNAASGTTPGERLNLSVLSKKFELLQKEYDSKNDSLRQNLDFRLDSVLTWRPKPQWALNMSVAEIDYLDHFIPAIPGFSGFLYRNQDVRNLYDLTAFYQLRLNATGSNSPEINFVLETIKERFYRIMDDHTDAIHYVNHSHTIDDAKLIETFECDARRDFYVVNLENCICPDFTNKYISYNNPYISAEIFTRLFRADKVIVALSFANNAFRYIFTSPNIYWHNKESIFGSVNILYMLVDALGDAGLATLKAFSGKIYSALTHSLYLLLSRSIYWTDKETRKDEKYESGLTPIHIQHKLRAYRLRSYLIQEFGLQIASGHTHDEYAMMSLSDMISAHELAYSNKIVGMDSVYKRDALSLYYTQGLVSLCSLEQAAEKGFVINDALSQDIHVEYKLGKFCLSNSEISSCISFLKTYFKDQKRISTPDDPPYYLIKDNVSPIQKSDKLEIINHLRQCGVKCFYHFTEVDKIDSIVKHGGLLSYKRCLDEGIVLPLREDMALSRDADAKLGLEDYARVSFSKHLPKIDIRKREGADLVMLKISLDVALFEDTLFTDIEATHPQMKYGKTFSDLMKVNTNIALSDSFPTSEQEFLQQQAEVLIKGIIPLKYILNIDNPEKI
ncbi:MAG: DUF4433 domain-containing protein [Bacteroides sp.]|nr:DUF4433 domain-containing protein [Bacteroides sp.]